MRISDVRVGSCREMGDSGSEGNEGDDEHQQALLEDGDDQGEGEGSSGHGHHKKKKKKNNKRESKVRAVQLCVACACACALVVTSCCALAHAGGSCCSLLWQAQRERDRYMHSCGLLTWVLSKHWPPRPEPPCLQDSKKRPTWQETLQPTLVAMIILLLLKLVQQAYLDSLPVFTSEALL